MFKSLYDDILEEGIKQGIEQGIQQAFEKGRHEEKYAMAEQCIREGLSILLTAKLTGLSEKEVEEMAERMKK